MKPRAGVRHGGRILLLITLVILAAGRMSQPLPAAENARAEIKRLVTELGADDLAARTAAALALIRRGESAREAFPALVKALTDDEALDRAVASRVIYARPRPAADAAGLLVGLEHDTKARAPAAWELSRIGPAVDATAVRALVDALVHPDKHERNFIVTALATSAAPGRVVMPGLLGVLRDPGVLNPPQRNYKYPRATAAIALGLIGPDAREAVPVLAGMLGEKALWEFQYAANCFALGRMGPDAAEALPALERARKEASPIVRAHADRAIRSITEAPAAPSRSDVPALLKTLATAPSRVGADVVDGLRVLGAFAGADSPAPKKGARKVAPHVHESISLALGYLDSLPQPVGPEKTVAFVAQEKAGIRSSEMWLYVMALGGVQQGIGPALLEALLRGDDDPRVSAARRLGELGPAAAAAAAALRVASTDLDWILRREALLALRRIETAADTNSR